MPLCRERQQPGAASFPMKQFGKQEGVAGEGHWGMWKRQRVGTVRELVSSQRVVRLKRRLRDRHQKCVCNTTTFIKLASLEAMCSLLFYLIFISPN